MIFGEHSLALTCLFCVCVLSIYIVLRLELNKLQKKPSKVAFVFTFLCNECNQSLFLEEPTDQIVWGGGEMLNNTLITLLIFT